MTRTIEVYLGAEARPLGRLHFTRDGSRAFSTFAYDPAWLAAADTFAIDPRLPLQAGPHFHRKTEPGSAFPSAIADTEPDGWGRRVILRERAKRRQRERHSGAGGSSDPLTDLDFLLAVDDTSRVGSLRFRDEDGIFQRAYEEGHRTTPPLIELPHLLSASRAVEMNVETAADLAYLLGRGTSLGGLRPKCTVLDQDGHLAIGKFPSVADERPVTKGEVLALRLATAAGVSAAQARLVDADGQAVALIRRFDRHGQERIPYVSAATLLGTDSASGEHAYTEMVDAIRRHGRFPQRDIEELWRRIAFFILITNVDDHLHNHGFLHVQHGQWELAPAFDVNPFPDRLRELKTWISEAEGPEATIESLMAVTAYFRITPTRAREILAQVEAAVSTWRTTGRALGLTPHELDQFEEAFEHEERVAARRACHG